MDRLSRYISDCIIRVEVQLLISPIDCIVIGKPSLSIVVTVN